LAAGLLVQVFRKLMAVDSGFQCTQRIVLKHCPPEARYPDQIVVRGFYNQLRGTSYSACRSKFRCVVSVVPFMAAGGGYAFTVEGYQPRLGEPARDTCVVV